MTRNLPAVPGAADPEVLEGRVVGPPRPAPLRVIRVVARHEHTRAVGRNLAYVPLGAAVVTRRLWDSRTAARYERWMRAAEASGDLDKVLALEERLAEFRRDRHQRRIDMIEVPAGCCCSCRSWRSACSCCWPAPGRCWPSRPGTWLRSPSPSR